MSQEWPGPSWAARVPERFYVSADDVPSEANMLGSVAFHFACYSAGTPKFDDYVKAGATPKQKAPESILAKLPARLLNRGALAVLGHIDLAWTYSFLDNNKPQLNVFKSPLEAIMKGRCVGHAAEYIDDRWAALATIMVGLQKDLRFGAKIEGEVARKWTQLTDARNYMLVGDPAVRLRVADAADSAPKIDLPTAVAPVVVTPAVDPINVEGLAFGSGEISAEINNLRRAITSFVDKLTSTFTEVTSDLAKIDVKTYIADDLDQIKVENGQFVGANKPKLAAHTSITFRGDQTTVVSSDDAIWERHQRSVEQAQTHRIELIKALMTAAGELADSA